RNARNRGGRGCDGWVLDGEGRVALPNLTPDLVRLLRLQDEASRGLPVLLNHVCIGVIRVIRGEFLLRCQGTNDFFEAWIAAERVPLRVQTQLAVGWTARDFRDYRELLDRQIAFARPGINPCQVGYKRRTIQSVFYDGQQLDRPPPFAQCVFFPPKCGVNDAQTGNQRRIIRVCADRCFLFCRRGIKCGAGRSLVSVQTSHYAYPKVTAKSIIKRILLRKYGRETTSGDKITFEQRKLKALRLHAFILCGGGIIGQ